MLSLRKRRYVTAFTFCSKPFETESQAFRQAGDVLSCGMDAVVSPRENEPDLILRVSFPNWVALERGPDYFEKLMEETFGGMDEAREAGIERGKLRTSGGEMMLREIRFTD